MLHAIAKFFNSGGSFMWVILAVLAASVAVMVERLIFYFIVCRKNAAHMSVEALKALSQGDVEGAKKAVEGNAPSSVLLMTAVSRYGSKMPYSEVEEGVQETAITELPRMTERLNYLSLFANIATLLGLIGTISGLQASFSSLASVEASKKAVMLAAGIAEAMNCTAFGLITAVPAMMMYTFLFNKQQRLSKDIDEAVVRMLNFFKKKPA